MPMMPKISKMPKMPMMPNMLKKPKKFKQPAWKKKGRVREPPAGTARETLPTKKPGKRKDP